MSRVGLPPCGFADWSTARMTLDANMQTYHHQHGGTGGGCAADGFV